MLIYDKAHELAGELKKCPEYIEYARLKEAVSVDEKTKALIADYKKLQFEVQAAYISGGEASEETMDKLKKFGEVLAFNKDVTEFFAAEYRFQTVMGDIYKILGEACDFGLDLLA